MIWRNFCENIVAVKFCYFHSIMYVFDFTKNQIILLISYWNWFYEKLLHFWLFVSFWCWFHEKRWILYYFFLKLISRKNTNIASFLSEIDFRKKRWTDLTKKSKNFEYLLLEIDLTFVQLMQHWIELSSSFLNSICTSIPDLLIKIQIGT